MRFSSLPCFLLLLLSLTEGRTLWKGQGRVPLGGSKLSRRRNLHGRAPATLLASSRSPLDESDFADDDDDAILSRRSVRQQRRRRQSSPEIRPWSMGTPPRAGHMSLSSKLVWTNVGVFALQAFFPGITRFGAKRSDLILSGRELHRLITPVFLHGGLGHLLSNSYSLRNVGPEVERLFGPGRFIATYLVSGVAGNMLSAVKSPNPAVGASGAIFGVVGAYYTFLHRNEALFGASGERARDAMLQTIGVNLFFGLNNPMIDNWGHIGGFLGGAAMAATFGPKLYVLGLPSGGRIIVDKPTIRLPRSIESLPEKLGNQLLGAKKSTGAYRFFGRSKKKNASVWGPPPSPNRSIRPRYGAQPPNM